MIPDPFMDNIFPEVSGYILRIELVAKKDAATIERLLNVMKDNNVGYASIN